MVVVFFFQAEDGIRDDLVTGVQTCALPIWRHHRAEHEAEAPVKAFENSRRNQGNRCHSESDQTESEKKDADQVVPKAAPGSGPCSRIEQWRGDNQQNWIRIQSDGRGSWANAP